MKQKTIRVLEKGFTLVELLIVIALLGALAIGLIGAIDPFEQLKKGQDTGTRNTVSEVQSAVIRYYALKGRMPWCTQASGDTCSPFPDGTKLSDMNGSPAAEDVGTALTTIVNTGELKDTFATAQSKELDKVFVTGDLETVKVCYAPVSKSFRADDNTKYDDKGEVNTTDGCPNPSVKTCYWCIE
jgi:prepilin-type N-terminal cleavage/methylation domain-containing protein